jgi:hypothetical protein
VPINQRVMTAAVRPFGHLPSIALHLDLTNHGAAISTPTKEPNTARLSTSTILMAAHLPARGAGWPGRLPAPGGRCSRRRAGLGARYSRTTAATPASGFVRKHLPARWL